LFVVALILLLIAVVSRVWERYCLVGLGYRRTLEQTRAFFGEEVPFTVEIRNEKPLPLHWLEVEDTLPDRNLKRRSSPRGPSHIPGRQAAHHALSCAVRASSPPLHRHVGARDYTRLAQPRSGPATSLAWRRKNWRSRARTICWCIRDLPLERLGLPASTPFGDVPLRAAVAFRGSAAHGGVREYRPGDSSRRMHWKATARAADQALQVKLFEPTTTHRLHVLLNVSTSGQNWSWQGYDPDALEAAITTAASVANWASDAGT